MTGQVTYCLPLALTHALPQLLNKLKRRGKADFELFPAYEHLVPNMLSLCQGKAVYPGEPARKDKTELLALCWPGSKD